MKLVDQKTSNWLDRSQDLLISISGIRGTIPSGLDPENVFAFACAFAYVFGKRIVIGRDTRPSGVFLHQLLTGILLATGKDVIDLGVVPTPSVKAMVKASRASGGIMITASHNPLDWNGFKLIDKNGLFFSMDKLQNWLDVLSAITVQPMAYQKNRSLGTYTTAKAIPYHIETILHYIENVQCIRRKSYVVVVDAVCGAGSEALPALLENLGCKVFRLYCETQALGTFPRAPEPTRAALRKLASVVSKRKASLGLAVDPDADRLAVASPKRGAIHEEYTLPLALLGLEPRLRECMQSGKSYPLVVNFSTSTLCDRVVKPYSAKVFRAPVGEANVLALMKKKKSVFGGEGNGGVIAAELPSCGRDSLLGAALILSGMARNNVRNVDELLDKLPPLFMHKSKHSLKRYSFKEVSEKLRLKFPEAKMNDNDGLYMRFADQSWLHLRSSNTEPVVRFIAEALRPETLTSIVSTTKGFLR